MLFLTLAAPLAAQSVSLGAVRGVVKDGTGRPLGNVRVALTDRTSGFTHSLLTPRAGEFSFAFVPVGEYDLLAERLGFQPVEIRGISITAGGDADLEITLASAEPPVLERAQGVFLGRLDRNSAGPGWMVGDDQLRNLADERSDLASAARFSTVSDDLYGMEGLPSGFSQVSVDGIPFRFPQHPLVAPSRNVWSAFPASAVAQAVIDPTGPDIEWTGFTSGRVSALGLRGTNQLRTRARADWAPRSQDGASGNSVRGDVMVSGPVIRDTAHFVIGVVAERLEVPLPAAAEPVAADAAPLAAFDSLGVDLQPYQTGRIAGVRLASGFGRLDWQANQRNRLAFLGFGSLLTRNDPDLAYGHAVGFGTRHEAWDLGLGATLTNVLSPAFALELRLGFEVGRQEYFGNDTALTSTTAGPIGWGTDPALPGRFERTGVRASETVHISIGSHRLKLGGGGSFASHADTYAFGREGAFVVGAADDLLGLTGGFAQSVGREPIAKFSNYEFGWFLQDRWTAAPGADLIVGFRMDWERVDGAALTRNQQLLARSGIVTDSIAGTAMKLSPRVGFTWDVGNKHSWVVRADGGVYQGTVPSDAFAEAVAEGGARQLRYGTGVLGTWPAVPDPAAAAQTGALVSVLPYNFSAPRSTKAAFGVSGALGGGTTLHLAGSLRHTTFLVRRRDLNRVPGQAGQDQYGRPIYGTLEQYGSALLPRPGSGRRLEEFAVVSALNQDGVSDYFGVTVRLERRFSNGLSMFAAYTASRTTDNLPGLALGPDAQLSPFPDSLDGVEWEEGVSDFDVPHRLVLGVEISVRMARLAAFYGLRSGRPFTPGFRDGVDANGDGSWRNDPAWVDDQVLGVADLFASWDCLRTQVGGFAGRNSCRGPSRKTLDLRFVLGPFRWRYPIEVVLDAMNLLDTELVEVDRALYLVDATGSLATDVATGLVTVPLVANRDFGNPIRRFGQGRYLRIGIRVGYE